MPTVTKYKPDGRPDLTALDGLDINEVIHTIEQWERERPAAFVAHTEDIAPYIVAALKLPPEATGLVEIASELLHLRAQIRDGGGPYTLSGVASMTIHVAGKLRSLTNKLALHDIIQNSDSETVEKLCAESRDASDRLRKAVMKLSQATYAISEVADDVRSLFDFNATPPTIVDLDATEF